MILRLRLQILLAAFLTTAAAVGQPKADPDIEITSRNQRMLDAISKTDLNLPAEPTRKDEITLVFGGGGGACTLFVVALPAEKAKDAAEAISSAIKGSQIAPMLLSYDAFEGKAVIKGTYEFGSFGKRRGELTVPVGKIYAELSSAGWKPTLFLRTHTAATVQADGFAKHESARLFTFGANKVKPDAEIRVEVKILPAIATTFYFFLFGPWVITFAGLTAGYFYAKNAKIDIKKRRKVYPKLVTWPTFGSIAIHAPIAFWFIGGRGYQPFSDLWFSTSSASPLIPFVALPLLPLFLMLPLVNKVERKLFGPDEGSPEPHIPEISPEEKAFARKSAFWEIAPFLVGIGCLASRSLFPNNHPANLGLLIAGAAIALAGGPIVKLILRKQAPVTTLPDISQTEADLQQLALKMGIENPVKLKLDSQAIGKATPYASISASRQITVSQRLLEVLEPAEIRAILAHELAHEKLGHTRQRVLLMLGFMILSLLAIVLVQAFGRMSATYVLPLMMGTPLLLAGPALFFLPKQRQANEYQSDRLMLETTSDLSTCLSALQKIASNSPMPYLHETEVASSHPALSKRLDKLREIGQELGMAEQPTVARQTN